MPVNPMGGKAGKASPGVLTSHHHPGSLLCSGAACRRARVCSPARFGPGWRHGEKGPDGAVHPLWATALPSELCLPLQEGQSEERSQAELKLVRKQSPQPAKGPLAGDRFSLTLRICFACRAGKRPQQACMGVVTGELCAFTARFQSVPIPPDTALCK